MRPCLVVSPYPQPLLLRGKEELWTKDKGGKENSDSEKMMRLCALSETVKELIRDWKQTVHPPWAGMSPGQGDFH